MVHVDLSPEHAGKATAALAGRGVDDAEEVVDELASRGVVFEQYDQPPMETGEKGIAVRWPLFLLLFTRVLGITHSPKLLPFLYPFILFPLCNTAGLITPLLYGRRKQEVRKKLRVLLTVTLIALMMLVASATPGMAAAKKYCVYYRGWHFISAKQFHNGNYKAYPARNCRGNAPGLGAQSANASAPSFFGSTASASASASATATATSTALASTGGPALALPATLVATVGVVGLGIVALRTVLRRGGASS